MDSISSLKLNNNCFDAHSRVRKEEEKGTKKHKFTNEKTPILYKAVELITVSPFPEY